MYGEWTKYLTEGSEQVVLDRRRLKRDLDEGQGRNRGRGDD